MEQVTLTVAETKPSCTFYKVDAMTFQVTEGRIQLVLIGTNGEKKVVNYGPETTPTGASLITALNKANLTTRSLNQRIFDRLVADGHLVGTVAGTVD